MDKSTKSRLENKFDVIFNGPITHFNGDWLKMEFCILTDFGPTTVRVKANQSISDAIESKLRDLRLSKARKDIEELEEAQDTVLFFTSGHKPA